MNMLKKALVLLLACAMLLGTVACGGSSSSEASGSGTSAEGEAVDYRPAWSEYNSLIAQIKSSTDFVEREALMHQAEDILMETGAICPLYYYNDLFMAKDGLEGYYSNAYGFKYFMYATYGDATTLRINLASEPDKLDPALNSSVDGACLAVNSFIGLYTYDAEGAIVPNAAADYEVTEDGLTYTFTLKDGLKWSDGTPLTAKDFEYSWKRAADPYTAADYSYMFNGIAGFDEIEIREGEELVGSDPDKLQVTASEDGKTLTVVLSAPCAYFLDLCAFPAFYPVQQATVEAAAGFKDADGNILNPGAWATEAGFVTSGAYTLESWTHNESMVYVKNPNYWDAENVKVERIEYMLSDDDTAIFAAYNAGNLDFIDTVPTDEIANLKTNPEFHIIDQLGTYYVCFNVKSPLFEGKTAEQASAMRRAFALLIDRDYIIQTAAQCDQKPANTFIPPAMLDGHGGEFKKSDDAYTYAVEEGYYPLSVDVEGAIALLESAGYKFEDGKLSAETPISFEYLTNQTSGHVAVAECIQQDFAAIGINMTIKTVDWDVFLNERKSGNYDIARNGWIADFSDPINMLEMWTTESGNNDCQFGR